MSKPAVIVDPHFRTMAQIFAPNEHRRLYELADVIWGKDEPMPQAAFLQHLPDAEVIMCAGWRYGDVLSQAKKLRAILDLSGGFPPELDYDDCYNRRIRVLSVAPSFARQVAEMCLGLALASSREIALGDREMRNGSEHYLFDGNINTFMLYDQPVSMIGYGSIARELHRLLSPFNVDVLAYDPWLGDGFLQRMGVTPVSLDSALSEARVIFVLANPSSENRAMLNREKLSLIQPNAVLVLGSRAHVVDFDAMTEFTLAGRFKVATDVFPVEPLSPDHPIRQAKNAVLSAHRAGAVKEGLWEIGEMVVDDLEAILKGLPPRRLQNAEPELTHRLVQNRAQTPDEAE